jgi:hypothetical protein
MHSGIGVKKLMFRIASEYTAKDSCYLDSWFQTAVTPGIEELILILWSMKAKYSFPYSVLSNGNGDSIRYLHLEGCSFHPTDALGWLRSLTRLHLCFVSIITRDKLGCLLSYYFALERMELSHCDRIVCLKVPCLLHQLSYLEVSNCGRLKVIDNKALGLSDFVFIGHPKVQLSLGDTLQIKNLSMRFSGVVYYARAELPSSMPNLEALTLHSRYEV